MGRILGIEDKSRKLDRWDLLLIPIFAGVLIWFMFTGRGHWFIIALAGVYVSFVGLVFFLMWRVRRQSFHRVAKLLRAGRVDEAILFAERRLERAPGDALTRLNLCSALMAAGRIEDARRRFGSLSRGDLSGAVVPLYDSIAERLDGPD